MSLDINKIILESIQDEAKTSTDDVVLEENVSVSESNVDTNTEKNINEEKTDTTNYCVASAISAGLGAMTFRNHLRSLNEISDKTKSRLKTAGKIGAGAAALGAAGWGAYKYGDDVKEKAGEIGRKLKDALTSPDKEAGTSQGMGANPGTVTAGNNSGVSSYKPNVGGMKRAVRLGGK